MGIHHLPNVSPQIFNHTEYHRIYSAPQSSFGHCHFHIPYAPGSTFGIGLVMETNNVDNEAFRRLHRDA